MAKSEQVNKGVKKCRFYKKQNMLKLIMQKLSQKVFVSVINAICLLFCLGKCFVNVFRNYLSVKLFLQTKRHACEHEFLHELQIISNVGVTDKYLRKISHDLIRSVAIGRGVFS